MINSFKNQKGITLITLILTVLLLTIITAVISINSINTLEISNLTKLENDIQALNDRVAAYYVKNGVLPITSETFTRLELQEMSIDLSQNDGNTYYVIDLSKLSNITLNYGGEYNQTDSLDKYIINEESHVIYYLKGVEYKSSKYYKSGNYGTVNIIDISSTEPVNPTEPEVIYALLFNDGTLVFNTTGQVSIRYDEDKLVKTYTNVGNFTNDASVQWHADGNYSTITKVDIEEVIHPQSTYGWFWGCSNLIEIKHIQNLDTSNVTTMQSMFDSCSSLSNLDLSTFITNRVSTMPYMFSGCSSLTSLNLSGFNTGNVSSMAKMFNGCSSLINIDLSSFNTSTVNNMQYMFNGCSALTSIDLSTFNTSIVTSMQYMFNGCENLTTIIVGNNWNTDAVTNSTNMFKNCSLIAGQRGTTYNSSYKDKAYAHIDGGQANPGYLTNAFITFTIESTEYTTRRGTTWGEWIASSENTNNYIIGTSANIEPGLSVIDLNEAIQDGESYSTNAGEIEVYKSIVTNMHEGGTND